MRLRRVVGVPQVDLWLVRAEFEEVRVRVRIEFRASGSRVGGTTFRRRRVLALSNHRARQHNAANLIRQQNRVVISINELKELEVLRVCFSTCTLSQVYLSQILRSSNHPDILQDKANTVSNRSIAT
jgi:hypothetical protein